MPTAWSSSPPTINGRSPIRSAIAPATGATVMNVAVHGSSRRPAPSGPYPSTVCNSWALKNTAQNSDAKVKKMAAFPAENARERKKCTGSIGSGARSSQTMNAATSSTPTASVAVTSRLNQPAWLPRTSPQTKPSAPAVIRLRPGMSRLESGPKLSSSRASTSGIAIRPIGTLIQKIHSQLMPSTTAPPTSGPLATAMPVIALKIPIAAPRFSRGKAALSNASPSGISSAEPAPCTARAAISQPTPGASAHPAEAPVNSVSPIA